MPKHELSAKFVEKANSGGKEREIFWDASQPGFGLMVTADGARSYVVQYRNAEGASRRMKLKGGTLAQARREAKAQLGEVAKGGDPLADKRKQRDAREDTLRKVVENEYLCDSDVKKLRSLGEKRGTFERYIFPTLGGRPVTEIKRSEIVRMLRRVKETNGPGAANNAFKVLQRFYTWFVPGADDEFNNPIVRGTWKQTKGEGARVLTDDEIRILWKVTGEGRNAFDHFIRFTLLTAARRGETAEMPRSEISKDGTEWTIPEERYKGEDGKSAHAHLIPLSPLARQVLTDIPVLQVGGKDSKFVFTTDGKVPISGFSKSKKALNKRLLAALEKEGVKTRDRIIEQLNELYPGKNFEPFGKGWSPHALRKTARTLLTRINVTDSIAEKCLGHVEGGIKGIYNHHDYKPEKRTAFEALAREVERIVEGKPAKVVPLSSARA